MGCDIHLYVETYKAGEWTELRLPILGLEDGYRRHWPGSDRNYRLFTVLAGVRSYPTSPIAPIAQPRGLPYDVSEPVKKEAEAQRGDAHSHSHVSLWELFEYDWDAPVPTYESSLRSLVGSGIFSLMQLMVRHSDYLTARIVFWFDN